MSEPSTAIAKSLDQLFKPDNYLFFHDTFMPPDRRELERNFLVGALDLRKDTALLDLGCGHGRHANTLAPLVDEVVGIDRDGRFLALARQEASEAALDNLDYLEGDILEIAYEARFDRVLLVNTIFGLFSDKANEDLLARIATALRPGGLLCLDVINRDTILADLKPHSVTELKGDYLIDRLEFDPASGRMTNDRVYIRGGASHPARFSLRLYNLTEITRLLANAGLVVKGLFGGWNGDRFQANAKKIIVIAQKPHPAAG